MEPNQALYLMLQIFLSNVPTFWNVLSTFSHLFFLQIFILLFTFNPDSCMWPSSQFLEVCSNVTFCRHSPHFLSPFPALFYSMALITIPYIFMCCPWGAGILLMLFIVVSSSTRRRPGTEQGDNQYL